MKKSIVYLVALATVFSLLPVVNLNYVSAQDSCDPDALRPVRFGQRGSAVRMLQVCLMELGYNISAGATGYYGRQTAAAVLEFYRDQGIQAGVRLAGRSFGPQGIEAMKNTFVAREEQQPEEEPTPSQQPDQQPTPPSNQQPNWMAQFLPLILSLTTGAQLDATTTQRLTEALNNNDMTTAMAIMMQLMQNRQQQQQQVGGEEGLLIVEKNPTPPSGQSFREGETINWLGVRFRAQDSDIRVQSFKLIWPSASTTAAVFNIVSSFEIVDDQNNVLRTISSADFRRDEATSDYYYYVTGLNYLVPKGQQKVLFVRAKAVPTFRSTGTQWLKISEIRGRDNAGIDRYPNTVVENNVLAQQTLATDASFVVSQTANSPLERNVLADEPNNNRANNVEMIRFSLTAKNDDLRLTELRAKFNNNNTLGYLVPSNAYLYRGNSSIQSASVNQSTGEVVFTNLISQNILIRRDSSEEFSIRADFQNIATSGNIAQVEITNLRRENTLGDNKSQTVLGVISNNAHLFTVGPEISLVSVTPQYTPPSQNVSSSYQVTIKFNVTPRGGVVYMGTTTNPTSTFINLLLERSDATTSSAGSLVVKLFQGTNELTSNPQLVHATTGMWILSEGQTYTFEVTASRVGVPPQGTGLWRWVVQSLKWTNDPADTPPPTIDSSWVRNTFRTEYITWQ